ncbi:MAG TPA: YifB family Mg chelatase-like AAA ATPase [Actinocrinis sp.]|jgi:magnesium chelatase family protein|uniref:YifB family Mg chelatase-like AAA ATPase n=1 Tax=Actinocrinis sp. TaxID=1920516 RepID=UPI002DDD7914|nr:YifB family Mg chelatase-like AAA ATPase [Actinocrinis sp.]HEV3174100.1 YifB family Mg chelatase-like AAA ATPase [Actinocrinis sp.]
MPGFGRAWSVGLLGLRGTPIEVEAYCAAGLPKFTLIGLPDSVLSEARDRVRAATLSSGLDWPQSVLTVSLSPAWIKKHGSGFDLAIAFATLRATGAVPSAALPDAVLIAELALDGRVRPIRGVLPCVVSAARAGLTSFFVAEANAAEAKQVPGVTVIGLRSLRQLAALANGAPVPDEPPSEPDHVPPDGPPPEDPGYEPDLSEVLGQYEARRALELSAAGGHHLFMCGAPGSGKTMLARRLPGILPPLDSAAALEVSAIHSLAGTLPPDKPLIDRPPFCAVHHSATVPSMVGGGGGGQIRPGAVSRAHRGVLFLDEAPEFGRAVLDSLREPIESGEVAIARASGIARFPARFLLVAAANPCPCGRAGSPAANCVCEPRQRVGYLAKISGPLLDRIDLRVDIAPVGPAELLDAASGGQAGEPSKVVAERVAQARERARRRLAGSPWTCNADVPGQVLRNHWPLGTAALASAERALHAGVLSARGLDRVIRVAWTVADLAGADRPDRSAVDTALGFRLGLQALTGC